jgi:hypothetical protein
MLGSVLFSPFKEAIGRNETPAPFKCIVSVWPLEALFPRVDDLVALAAPFQVQTPLCRTESVWCGVENHRQDLARPRVIARSKRAIKAHGEVVHNHVDEPVEGEGAAHKSRVLGEFLRDWYYNEKLIFDTLPAVHSTGRRQAYGHK